VPGHDISGERRLARASDIPKKTNFSAPGISPAKHDN